VRSPHIDYSADALDGFISEVAEQINRPARDATGSPAPASLNAVPAQDGVTVRADALRSRVRAAIESPTHRTVSAPVERVEPKVTTDQLAQHYPTFITIDRAAFQLRFWQNLKPVKTYTIAVGQAGLRRRPAVHDRRQAGQPVWHVPDSSAWAGDLAGRVIPPGPPTRSARWMGFYAARHPRQDGSPPRHGRIARLRPNVDPGRGGALRPGPARHPIYIGD
jgi:hypothetical protein